MSSEIMERETALPIMMSDEIHHSIADADDIEEVSDSEISVRDVCVNVLRHPLQLITRWNWKSVLLAVLVRAAIYLVVYTISKESTITILTAVVFEAISRFLTTGVAGALVQSFRKATPFWLANLIVSILLPAFSHTVEYLTHYTQEHYYSDMFAASQNSGREKTFPISVLFSVVSVLFNLYAMRNGALLVGAGEATQTLRKDFTQIPGLIWKFVGALPNMICRYIERGRYINAFATIFAFGFTVGSILATTRGKLIWGINSSIGAWSVLIFATVVCLIARKLMGINGRNQSHVR